MKKRPTGLVLLLLIHFSLFSQKHLVKGYVVTAAGDTLQGQIDYKGKGRNPENILFLKNGANEFANYKPADLKCFAVPGEFFFSKTVACDVSPDNVEYLSSSPVPLMKTGCFFLSAYVLGNVSLYYLNDETRRVHFFIEKDTSISELIHNRYKKEVGGISYIIESDRYKQQLLSSMGDCPALAASIDKLPFNTSSLIGLFTAYNSCKNTPAVFIQQQEKIKFRGTVLAGASITKLHFQSPLENFSQITNYKASVDFTGGLGLNIIFPKNRRSWSVYNDLLYKHYKASATVQELRDDPNDIAYKTYFFDYSYIKLTTMVRYQYPGKKIKPYINLGLTNGYAVKNKSTQTVDEQYYTYHRHYTEDVYTGVRVYNQGLAAGVGGTYKNFNLELRYELDNGMSNSVYVGSLTNSTYFFLGYSF